MDANPFQSAKARSKPQAASEACDECGSSLTYNRFRNESVCDGCGLVSDTSTHIEDLDRQLYEATHIDQRAVRQSNAAGTSTTWSLDGKDASGDRIQDDVLRLMRRLNKVDRNSYRIKPQERRSQAFNEHLKPRLMELEQDWTGEMSMLYRESESMYLAVCGHMELRQLRHTNTLRSRYPPEMKWDLLALVLQHEWRRDSRPLAHKISKSPHRYFARTSSSDVARFVDQYNRVAPLCGGRTTEKTTNVREHQVIGFVVKVLKAINQVFSPQNDAEFAHLSDRPSFSDGDRRRDSLVLMVETVAKAHGVNVPRERIFDVHRQLLRHEKYPTLLSPNHLRSCHVEVTYRLLRACAPEGPTVPRTKVTNAIATEPTIAGTVARAPQKAWGAMAQACVNEVMQHV